MRITRVSEDGQKLEVMVDEKTERFSEIVFDMPEPETVQKPIILEGIEQNEATFRVGFADDYTSEGGYIKAEIQRQGALSEMAEMQYGFYVKSNNQVVLEREWPSDVEDTERLRVDWSPGDEIELHMWMVNGAGTSTRTRRFTVQGEAPREAM